jgi:chromate reductase
VRILALSGSLRAGSYNTALLRAAAEAAPAGVALAVHPPLAAIPPYDEDADVEPAPFEVRALRRAIENADAVLLATPEYNGSIPGQLKHAIDWASRPYGRSSLWGKPVAVIGASTGSFGGIRAQDDLRRVLKVAGARVCADVRLAVPRAHEQIADDGGLRSEAIRAGLGRVLEALSSAANGLDRAA